jgi:hypothetical protein
LGGIVCTKQRKTIPRDRGRGWKKGKLLQVLGFFAVFVRGGMCFGGVLNELIHRNRGVNGQFYDVFERNMRKEWFNNQVPGCFPEVDRLWTSR